MPNDVINKQLVTTDQLDRVFTEENENIVDYIRDGAGGEGKVKDVQVDGESILVNKVANIELKPLTESADKINKLIPDAATENNKLVDKKYVDDSLSSQTALFRGTVNTEEELKKLTGENNDFAFIAVIDETTKLVKQYDRYKYNGEQKEWLFEYTLNNSSFTSEQWNAIISGITETKVTQIETNKTAITTNATAITTNATAISTEKARAEAAEKALEDKIKIDDVQVDGTSVVSDRIANIKLNDITTAVNTNTTDIGTLKTSVATNTTAIATNTTAISTNATAIKTETDARVAKDATQDAAILANTNAINEIKITDVQVDDVTVVEDKVAKIKSKVKDIKINDVSIIDATSKEAAITYDNETEKGFFIEDLTYDSASKKFTLNRTNDYKDEDLNIQLKAMKSTSSTTGKNGILGVLGTVRVAHNDIEVSGSLLDGTRAGVRTYLIYTAGQKHKLKVPLGYEDTSEYIYDNNTLLVTGDLYQAVKWADLVALRDQEKLVKGKTYRITDYKCTTTQANTKSANAIYDILVVADDAKTLNENARAIKHEWTQEEIEQYLGAAWEWGEEVAYDKVEYVTSVFTREGEAESIIDNSHNGQFEWKEFTADGHLVYGRGYATDSDYLVFDSVIEYNGEFVGKWIRWEESEDTPGTWSTDNTGETAYILLRNGVENGVIKKINQKEKWLDTLGEQHLSAWELKYCLDNDSTRFGWAKEKVDIVNRKVYTDDGLWFEYKGIFDIGGENYYAWYSPDFDYDGYPGRYYLGTKVDYPEVDGAMDCIDVENGDLISEGYSVIEQVDYSEVHKEGGTGVVYYMKDEYNNEAPYDFKNIQFKRNFVSRWNDSVGGSFSDVTDYPTDGYLMSDLWVIDAAYFGVDKNYRYYYTFTGPNYCDASLNEENAYVFSSTDYYTRICHNNHIGVYKVAQAFDDDIIHIVSCLNDIVFKETVDDPVQSACKIFDNNIGDDCRNMTFDEHCSNISIGTDSYNIVICNSVNVNLGNCNRNIFIGVDCWDVSIGNNCRIITLDALCSNCVIGENNGRIYLYQGCEHNVIGDKNDLITIWNYSYSNSIGNSNNTITIYRQSYNNSIGNLNTNISINEKNYNNVIGDLNTKIEFVGFSNSENVIGNYNNTIKIYSNCTKNFLGNWNMTIHIYPYDCYNYFGDYNNGIALGSSANTLARYCRHNSFGNNNGSLNLYTTNGIIEYNNIGNFNSNFRWDGHVFKNTIGNYNSGLNLYHGCGENVIGNNNEFTVNNSTKMLLSFTKNTFGNNNMVTCTVTGAMGWRIGNNNIIYNDTTYPNFITGKADTMTTFEYLTMGNDNKLYISGPENYYITMGNKNIVYHCSNSRNVTIGNECTLSLTGYWENVKIGTGVNLYREGYAYSAKKIENKYVHFYVKDCEFDDYCKICFERDETAAITQDALMHYHGLTCGSATDTTTAIVVPQAEVVYNDLKEKRVGVTGTTEVINKEYTSTPWE